MTDKNKHISYSIADIEKYWKGELSAAAMHDMEKAALEDPLLPEAMEGVRKAMAAGSFHPSADIEELQQRLAARVGAGKVRSMTSPGWWRIAVAFILIASGSAVAYLLVNRPARHDTAKNEAAGPLPGNRATRLQADSTRIDQGEDSAAAGRNNDIAATENKQPPAPDGPRKILQPMAKTNPGQQKDRPLVAASTARDMAENALAKQSDAVPATPRAAALAPAIAANEQRKDSGRDVINFTSAKKNGTLPASPHQVLSGTVVDAQLKPIANAAISIRGSAMGTITDSEGNFSLLLPDSAQQLSIASAGFRSYDFSMGNNVSMTGNRFTLQRASNELDEVVVAGYGNTEKKAAKAKALSVKVLDAEPVDGWNAYNEYLENNRRLPAALQSIHGDVVLSFVVNGKGMLKNFRVVQGLQDTIDREAVRLVKEGPAWRPLHGKKAPVTLIVKF